MLQTFLALIVGFRRPTDLLALRYRPLARRIRNNLQPLANSLASRVPAGLHFCAQQAPRLILIC